MNRGSARGHHHSGGLSQGFNEAPIHESGKFAGRSDSRLPPCCFNEAPIHESGKSRARGHFCQSTAPLQ